MVTRRSEAEVAMSEANELTNLLCAQTHTPCPDGYLDWHEWAEKKSRTHTQEKCPHCGLWAVWKRKPKGT
jgi:hypothetical protein